MREPDFPEHPCVPLSAEDVDESAYAELRDACRRLEFLPTFRHGILLEAAMVEPADQAAVAEIRRLTHQEVRRFGISRADFDRAAARLEDSRPSAAPDCVLREDPDPAGCPEFWDFSRRSAREIAGELVRFAFSVGASDLLLDDQEDWLEVAVKLAGRKEILPPVDRQNSAALVKAFKEIAGMSTHTVTRWQSGFASLALGGGRRADLRIEVTPTVHGESLVARVQDRERQLGRMAHLPFNDLGQVRMARACLRQHQGLIIACGPTGHGKTTTLYACLGQLDRSALNIRTLEDPVEFTVPWITQIPVGTDTGRSFEEGLKSLLRQAPHVILMGEIRDRAAAQACAEAVDTGHLILATLHARDGVGAVTRLLDLGLSGRQISAALTLVIGQRLVRRLCPHCRKAAPPTPQEAAHFGQHGLPVPERLHSPGGCPRCGGRGERGVAPLFEFFHPAGRDELEEAIGRASRESFSERELRRLWIGSGGSPLVREGLLAAAAGEIAHAEVLKFERNPPAC